MLVRKAPRSQTKAASRTTNDIAGARAMSAAHGSGHSAAEQTFGDPRLFWDFSSIGIFEPEGHQSSSAGALAVSDAINEAVLENNSAVPPTQAAFVDAIARLRVRDDASAGRSALLLGAEAVAFGDEIMLRSAGNSASIDQRRALIAHELTHLADQSQTGRRYPQLSVAGDILSVHFTRGMADAMTNDELDAQMKILRAYLKNKPGDAGPAENLAMLEEVAETRQGTAHQTLPAPSPAQPPPPPPPPVAGGAVSAESSAGGETPVLIVMTEAEYQEMSGLPASSLPEGSPSGPREATLESGVPASVGAGSFFLPTPNWYYRVLSAGDPSLSQIQGGADLLPRQPDPGFTFKPAANPAEMTFRHLRPGGNVPQIGTDRISTAGDLEPFENVLKDRGTGELARVDVNAARRLGAEFLEHGPIEQHLEQVERDLQAKLSDARAAGRGKNAIAALEKRLGYLQRAREYARRYREGQGVGRIPSGAITGVRGETLSQAVAGERLFLSGLKFFRYGGRVMAVVGAGMSVYNVASAPPGQTGRVAARETGGWAFSLAGAAAGAKIGAAGGGALGFETGPGAIVSAAIGSLIGAAIGFAGGEEAAEKLYDIGDEGLKLLGDTPRLIETTTIMFGSAEDRRRYNELRELETGEPSPLSDF